MALCDLTDEYIASCLKRDTSDEEMIREGSRKLIREIWKKHPDRMRNMFFAGTVRIPDNVSPVVVKQKPKIKIIAGVAKDLVQSVACDMGLTSEQIRSESRIQRLVAARAIIAIILQKRGWSLNKIAPVIGRSDHSTVCNLLKKADYLISNNRGAKTSFKKNMDLYGPVEVNNG